MDGEPSDRGPHVGFSKLVSGDVSVLDSAAGRFPALGSWAWRVAGGGWRVASLVCGVTDSRSLTHWRVAWLEVCCECRCGVRGLTLVLLFVHFIASQLHVVWLIFARSRFPELVIGEVEPSDPLILQGRYPTPLPLML